MSFEQRIPITSNNTYLLTIANNNKVHLLTKRFKERLRQETNKPVVEISILPHQAPSLGPTLVVNQDLEQKISDKVAHPTDVIHLSPSDFNAQVSESESVRRTIEEITRSQAVIYANIYKNTPELDLGPYVKILGPDGKIVEKIDDKVDQRDTIVKPLNLPIPRTFPADSREELLEVYRQHFNGPAFVMNPYSSGGSGTIKVFSEEDFKDNAVLDKATKFLISDLLDVENSPSTLAIVSGNDVLNVGLSDQIMNGVQYLGNASPSTATSETQESMLEMTKKIGFKLQDLGYRGPFGVDFMIDQTGQVYFTEINPRIIGATPDLSRVHEIVNPQAPSIVDLIYEATVQDRFSVSQEDLTLPKEHWASYAVKVTSGSMLQEISPPSNVNTRFEELGHTPAYHHLAGTAGKISFASRTPYSREEMMSVINEESKKFRILKNV